MRITHDNFDQYDLFISYKKDHIPFCKNKKKYNRQKKGKENELF